MKAGYILPALAVFSAALVTAEDADFCHDLNDGYHPDPKNCIKYYHCFNHAVQEHITCPHGNTILYLNNVLSVHFISNIV